MELPWVNYNFKSIRWCLPGVSYEQASLDLGAFARRAQRYCAIPRERKL